MGGVLTATPTRFLRHVNLVRHRRCRGSDCPRFRRGRKSHLGVADGRLAAHGGLVVQPLQRTPHHLQQYVETSGLSARLSVQQLASIQPDMARALAEYSQFFVLSLAAGFAGIGLSVLSVWKKLRGLYAGIAFLASCASSLYASFAIVFTIPPAAKTNLRIPVPQFLGQYAGGSFNTTWTPLAGWVLVIGAGLAFAWASSDLWHLVPGRKLVPKKMEVTIKRIPTTTTAAPPAPAELVPSTPEPDIEEVFVISSNSLLIKHMSRSLMSDKDRDVVGSMISAISSFVREAFTERDGEVHEVTLGDHRFVMCSDRGIVLAVLVSSGDTEDIVHRLRHLLAILDDRYGDRLATWQGESLEGIEDELQVLWQPYHLPPPPPAT